MRGTSNTKAGLVTGNPLTPDHVNDLTKIAVGADDDALYELLGFEPPAGVTSTTPRVGFLPLTNGPVVEGHASQRKVKVNPLRAFRSSLDNTKPREMLSGVVSTQTEISLPADVGAGNWRLELLYAELTYVDASKPENGTQITLKFAATGAGAGTGGAATVATLPANTASPPVYNIPLAYVKSIGGATSIATEDILEFPGRRISAASGRDYNPGAPDFHTDPLAEPSQAMVLAKKIGIEARRAYSSENHDPTKMMSGGTSVWSGTTQRLTSTITPALLGRHNTEQVIREILVGHEKTGPNGGASEDFVVDDTRDWRGANFFSVWTLGQLTIFGEDDPGQAGTRAHPAMQVSGGASWLYLSAGQSWNAFDPGGSWTGGSKLWAATIGVDAGAGKILGPTEQVPTGDALGLFVDASTGALKFYRKRAGAAADGPSCWIRLEAFFANHRA